MTQRVLIALSVLNLGLLVVLLAQIPTIQALGIAPVLRGRSLEIVDDQGRVRASIKVHPADQTASVPYPDTAVLRLVDPNGRPSVKLANSVQGAILALVGEGDATFVQLQSGTDSSVKLTGNGGRQQLITP